MWFAKLLRSIIEFRSAHKLKSFKLDFISPYAYPAVYVLIKFDILQGNNENRQ